MRSSRTAYGRHWRRGWAPSSRCASSTPGPATTIARCWITTRSSARTTNCGIFYSPTDSAVMVCSRRRPSAARSLNGSPTARTGRLILRALGFSRISANRPFTEECVI